MKLVEASETCQKNSEWLDASITSGLGQGKCLNLVYMEVLDCSAYDTERMLLVMKDRKHADGFKNLTFATMSKELSLPVMAFFADTNINSLT